MNINYWKNWAMAALVRAIRTFAQVAIAGMPMTSVADVNWEMVMGTAALAALLSVLTSLSGLPEVNAEQAHRELLQSANAAADDLISFTEEFAATDIATQETVVLEPADELGY